MQQVETLRNDLNIGVKLRVITAGVLFPARHYVGYFAARHFHAAVHGRVAVLTEFFGFFTLAGEAASVLGPLVWAGALSLFPDKSPTGYRTGLLVLFVVPRRDRRIPESPVSEGRWRAVALRLLRALVRLFYRRIETAGLAVPGAPRPLRALCVVPFGMEEGTDFEVPGHEFGLVVGEHASFRFLSSLTRRKDPPGSVVEEWDEGEIVELAPLDTMLPAEGAREGALEVVSDAPPNLPVTDSEPAIVQVVPSGPDTDGDPLYDAILTAIFTAQRSIRIVTPYFIPDEPLLNAIQLAVRRGVEVKVIVPAKSNHPLTDIARRVYLRDICQAGAKVYYYRSGMIHAKALLVDGMLAMIGSANMDSRSLFLNYEAMLVVYSAKPLSELRSWMDRIENKSVQQDFRVGFTQNILEHVIQLFAPLL